MADTVSSNKNDDEYKELIDEPSARAHKIHQLASLIRKHKGKVVVYTGAGISTGAGIPDFRSGIGSVTGMPAGKWCQNATLSQWSKEEIVQMQERSKKTTSCLQVYASWKRYAVFGSQTTQLC